MASSWILFFSYQDGARSNTLKIYMVHLFVYRHCVYPLVATLVFTAVVAA